MLRKRKPLDCHSFALHHDTFHLRYIKFLFFSSFTFYQIMFLFTLSGVSLFTLYTISFLFLLYLSCFSSLSVYLVSSSLRSISFLFLCTLSRCSSSTLYHVSLLLHSIMFCFFTLSIIASFTLYQVISTIMTIHSADFSSRFSLFTI